MNDQRFLAGVRASIAQREAALAWARGGGQMPSALRLAAACLVGLAGLIYPHAVAALCLM